MENPYPISAQDPDPEILSFVFSLTDGRGDGRISLEDARELNEFICRKIPLTPAQRATIVDLDNHVKWTEKAREWFEKHSPVVDEGPLSEQLEALLEAFELSGMEVEIDPDALETMQCRFRNSVDFVDAFRQALQVMVSAEGDNTPWAETAVVLNNVFELDEPDFVDPLKWKKLVSLFLQDKMRQGYMQLIPVYEDIPDSERLFQTPGNGEPSAQYWIFYLGIITDDHHFWAVVDRAGVKPPYVYGYN